MVAPAIGVPNVALVSIPFIVKFWLTDAVDGAAAVRVIGVLIDSLPMA